MTERERFEAFISALPYRCHLDRYSSGNKLFWPGCYIDHKTQLAWEAWQAALGIDEDKEG